MMCVKPVNSGYWQLLFPVSVLAAALMLSGCINPKNIGVQTNGTITGRILDAKTDIPIAAANVRDELDRQAAADPDGAFSIVLPSGTHNLLISAVGYQTAHVSIDVPKRTTILISKDGYERLNAVPNP